MLRRPSSTYETVLQMYDSASMVSRRIERLLSVGLLVESRGELRLTPAGRRVAYRFAVLRKFFGHSTDPDTAVERASG
jgi:Mn-dependent DtxR family transcriptional regulator